MNVRYRASSAKPNEASVRGVEHRHQACGAQAQAPQILLLPMATR
jgi:hypothetical protein